MAPVSEARPIMPPAGWKKCAFSSRGMPRFYKGSRTISAVSDEDGISFVISEHETWRPGCFADIETAIAAFDVDDERLSQLQDEANAVGVFKITAEALAHHGKGPETRDVEA